MEVAIEVKHYGKYILEESQYFNQVKFSPSKSPP